VLRSGSLWIISSVTESLLITLLVRVLQRPSQLRKLSRKIRYC